MPLFNKFRSSSVESTPRWVPLVLVVSSTLAAVLFLPNIIDGRGGSLEASAAVRAQGPQLTAADARAYIAADKDEPESAAVGGGSAIDAAVSAAFDTSSGEVVRRTRAGMSGVEVELVTHLIWGGESGQTSMEMVVDDRYLSAPGVSDFVEATNRELAAEARDLRGVDLLDALARAQRTVVGLLDGITLEPSGLGWWEGRVGGPLGAEVLRLHMSGGRLRSVSRTFDAVGSIGGDTWDFAG